MKSSPSVRPFSLLVWFVLPAAILFSLVFNAPHELDAAIARLVWANGSFPFQNEETLLAIHRYAAVIPAIGALFTVRHLIGCFAAARRHLPYDRAEAGRMVYLLAAMLLCVLTVWWLKGTTGVACPWSVSEFGGTAAIGSPAFSLAFQSGKCWPGGFAGTGFCMFALYFAFRDKDPGLARAGFAFALMFGVFCGAVQMIRGAHFFSHNLATLCIDWLVCAAVYTLVFGRSALAARFASEAADRAVPGKPFAADGRRI